MSWDDHYATDAGARWWPNEELVRFLSGKRFDRVLDVGCGTGANTTLLGCHAPEVVAFDPSEKALRLLADSMVDKPLPDDADIGTYALMAEAMAERIQFRVDLRTDWPGDMGPYDLVVDCMTSQHISWADHVDQYKRYERELRPGGWLWLYHLDNHTVCEKATRYATGEPPKGIYQPNDFTHLSLFPSLDMFCLPSNGQLVLAIEQAGLGVKELRGLRRIYPDGDVASYTIIAARKPE